tara:strand:- start:335 stop:754 length:420 start_codon:yes stop_codon:yes gene_type:complete
MSSNINLVLIRVIKIIILLFIIIFICNIYKKYKLKSEKFNNIVDNYKQLNINNNDDPFYSMIHNTNPRKEYLTNNMVVPTYSQDSYIPSENNRVISIDNKLISREDKKINTMNVLNLCYQDSNDDLNINLVAKNLHISP